MHTQFSQIILLDVKLIYFWDYHHYYCASLTVEHIHIPLLITSRCAIWLKKNMLLGNIYTYTTWNEFLLLSSSFIFNILNWLWYFEPQSQLSIVGKAPWKKWFSKWQVNVTSGIIVNSYNNELSNPIASKIWKVNDHLNADCCINLHKGMFLRYIICDTIYLMFIHT